MSVTLVMREMASTVLMSTSVLTLILVLWLNTVKTQLVAMTACVKKVTKRSRVNVKT